MPTPIDRAVSQRGPFLAFAAIVTGVAAWSIWGEDLFPSQDPKGDPETWTHEQCVTWLKKRNLHPSPLATTPELLERIKANMRIAKSGP
ncbi:hypothetical protein DPSP01_001207 [Paraphaeosphaeria sporulosa]|uniref:STE24 endopeptidase n=1 Tax=Paraphaeosphaeria sporulosa TaxID=1460663 RepID=A0A177C1B7_9PLEO|nr:uncharacterized protein CC84DRAFT_1168513 [Paraphaeosphaeria sporulosa]OAG00410.1 hypothetical protein CC84DRAFT_1168513 [Paraphaeosphaeria sporulosa]